MNATPTYNNRHMIIFIAILIAVLLVLAVNVIVWILLMRGGMLTACTNMMQKFQSP